MYKLRYRVLIPSTFIALLALVINISSPAAFADWTGSINSKILMHFGTIFSQVAILCTVMCLILFISPFGKTLIGDSVEQRIMSPIKLFSVVLCTTIATGILLWGTAEPLYHFHQTPVLGEGDSALTQSNKISFSLSIIYLHWTIVPYSIYSLVAISFAYAFYNRNEAFSFTSIFEPILGSHIHNKYFKSLIDNICLFALMMGMSASLGAAILIISGGANHIFDIPKSSFSIFATTFVIVLLFTISAGIKNLKGIQTISFINVIIFIFLLLFVFLNSSPTSIFSYNGMALSEFVKTFVERTTDFNHELLPKEWKNGWTTFYWANWMAWTPITAMFLGRISVGYSIRQILLIQLVSTSFFGFLWMAIFSGASLYQDILSQGALYQTLLDQGTESVTFALLEQYPSTFYISAVFLLSIFLSYVSSADSNTSAMSALCIEDVDHDNPESPLYLKLFFGFLIGTLSYIMITTSDIEGIKMLSNIGGLPILFLIIMVVLSSIRLILQSFLK